MENIVRSLKIDKELLLMTPPLSDSDSRLLKIRLIEGIDTAAVHVWNTTVLDSFEKYEICIRQGIPFETEAIPVRNKQEAIVWICKEQLKRKDLSPEIRRFLIGKRYIAELKLSKDRKLKTPNRPNTKKSIRKGADRVRDDLGREYSLSPDQLNRYRMYARAMEKMAVAVPEIYGKVMNKSIILSVKPTIKYSRLSESDMRELSPQILGKPCLLNRIIRGVPIDEKPPGRPKVKRNRIDMAAITLVQKHDSNAEIMSLASTVPAWTRAIERVMTGIDIAGVSDSALAMLDKNISELSTTIFTINKIVKESKNVGN